MERLRRIAAIAAMLALPVAVARFFAKRVLDPLRPVGRRIVAARDDS